MDFLIFCLGSGLILVGIVGRLPPAWRARLWVATRATLAQCAMVVCLVSGSAILAYDWLWQTTATATRAVAGLAARL